MSGDWKYTQKKFTSLEETFCIQTLKGCQKCKTLNSLVVQNNIRPPNLIRWNPYVLNPIILHRDPSEFVVIPDLKQTDSLNKVVLLMTWLKDKSCSHVSAKGWSPWSDSLHPEKITQWLIAGLKVKEWANQWCPFALTTLTSWDMETSNSTVTGSDTFSTGLMNWLYLLNNLRNKRSSDFDEAQPDEGWRRGKNVKVFIKLSL